jgi:DNA-directed RNA polymerase specialized sigma24 family protein
LPAESTQTLVESLVVSHGEQLRRFLLARVCNTADVADIVQEVYLRMMRVPNVESIRSPEAYLFTVAAHVVQQHTLKQSAAPPSADLTRLLAGRDPQLSHADPALTDVTITFRADNEPPDLSGRDRIHFLARCLPIG